MRDNATVASTSVSIVDTSQTIGNGCDIGDTSDVLRDALHAMNYESFTDTDDVSERANEDYSEQRSFF